MTCFHLYIVLSDTRLLVRRQEESELSNQVPALIGWTLESHQLSQQFACGATEDFRS